MTTDDTQTYVNRTGLLWTKQKKKKKKKKERKKERKKEKRQTAWEVGNKELSKSLAHVNNKILFFLQSGAFPVHANTFSLIRTLTILS